MRLITTVSLLFLMGVVLMSACSEGTTSDRADSPAAGLLPEAPQQWKELGETQVFTGVALSDYINGGAEAYFAYGFKEVAVREFTSGSGARLTVEIYEMDRPENAYGIFSTDPAGERLPIGADASYGSGLLRFWKACFFVRILCYPADEVIERVITDTGTKIAASLPGESRRPELLLSLVPETEVDPDSICYFHRQTSLNNIRFLTDENVLHLDDDVDAITWVERVGASPGDTLRQIVLRYPTATEAETAHRDFSRKYFGSESGASSSAAPPLPNGKYSTAGLRASWVIVVLDAASYESASMAFKRTFAALDMMKRTEGPS